MGSLKGHIITDHTRAISESLSQASTAQQVLDVIRYVSAFYLEDRSVPPGVPGGFEGVLQSTHRKVEALAEKEGSAAVKSRFWMNGFADLAEILLSADNLDENEDLKKLLRNLFGKAPASALLTALLTHLSMVQPLQIRQPRSSLVTAVGGGFAAGTIRDRFILPGSSGIAELMTEVENSFTEQGLEAAGAEAVDRIAAQLASIPERTAATWIPELQAPAFVGHLVDRCLTEAVANSRHSAQPDNLSLRELSASEVSAFQNRGGAASTSAISPKGIKEPKTEAAESWPLKIRFLGAVLAKLSKRGYSSQVAAALWAAECGPLQGLDCIGWVLKAVSDGSAAEKLLEALIVVGAASGVDEDELLNALHIALKPKGPRYPGSRRDLLEYKLLVNGVLPPRALRLLLRLLERDSCEAAGSDSLRTALLNLAQAWSSAESITNLSPPRQAYLTAGLVLCIRMLTKQGESEASGVSEILIGGISIRLDSALEPIRRQGMRLGHELAKWLNPQQVLFEGWQLELMLEEAWHKDCAGTEFGIPSSILGRPSECEDARQAVIAATPRTVAKEPGAARVESGRGLETAQKSARGCGDLLKFEDGNNQGNDAASAEADTATDSDDSLEAYDLKEDDEDDAGIEGNQPVQLKDVAEMLRKTDDPKKVLRGLQLASLLIDAAPDELATYADLLSRSLLFCEPPDWEDLEKGPEKDRPKVLQYRAIVSLLVSVPHEGGSALAAHLYSPNLNLSQRLLLLSSMADAATQMATPPSQARAVLQNPQSQEPSMNGKSRRWGVRSLALQKAAQKTFRNKFPTVAFEWTSALLKGCEEERHGVDLFGKDHLLLGRLLTTLAQFAKAASPSIETAQIAAPMLEMLRFPAVHLHPEPFVRHSALIAAAEVLSCIPPALVGAAAEEGPIGRERVLLEQLQWLQEWLSGTARRDPDSKVRMLAAHCLSIQAGLADRALEMQASAPRPIANLVPLEMMGLTGKRSAVQTSIKLPQVEKLELQ